MQRCIVRSLGYDKSPQDRGKLVLRPARNKSWRARATVLNIFEDQATRLLHIQSPVESGLERGPLHNPES